MCTCAASGRRQVLNRHFAGELVGQNRAKRSVRRPFVRQGQPGRADAVWRRCLPTLPVGAGAALAAGAAGGGAAAELVVAVAAMCENLLHFDDITSQLPGQ